MADEPKNPRKIKDLKARLGRTIAPNTPGAVMPPAAGDAKPASSGGVLPPSKGAVVPPTGLGGPKIKKAVPTGSPFAPKASVPPASNDPFAASSIAPQGPQQIRLVLDDSAVDDAEVGKKARGRNFILLGLGAVLGLALGFGTGSVMNDRKTTNLAIRDAKSIHEAVQASSAVVSNAQRLVDQAAAAAVSNPPTVDYEAIDQLRQVTKPFPADVFSRKSYFLFEPATVDALFNYYQTTNQAWSAIDSIVGLTAGDDRRTQLNEAAEAAGASRQLVGCIPGITEDRLMCSLGFVDIEEVDGTTTVSVRASRRGRRGVEKEVYTGQELGEDAANYVILVNTSESTGVLGEQASLFNQYLREIAALKQLLTTAVEAQGAVETGVGPIAGRSELFAL